MFLPDDAFKRFWNILMIFLLIYVASYVPFGICFVQKVEGAPMTTAEIIDIVVDAMFLIDIVVNFVSAYEDDETGLPIVNLRKIAIHYLSTWFVLDFLAVLPVQLIEDLMAGKGNQFKLARLARLPRLYRLIRILRMIKMLRVFKRTHQFKEWMSNLNISVGMVRMLYFLAVQFFMVHLMACFWFMAATLEDNMYMTWVGERGIIDESPEQQYLQSFYWAFQTVTTVGYGDVSVQTSTEYVLALLWMIIGVNFYSFTIGNVSSIIAAMDAEASVLNSKIQTLNDYTVKYKLPQITHNKIRKYFENQARTKSTDGDWEELFQELPSQLRTEVIQSTHGQIINGIKFFRDKSQSFLISMIPRLKNMNLYDNDILFSQGDQAEEIFFMYHGSVLHYIDITDFVEMKALDKGKCFNIPFSIYTNGSYFGDNDVLLQKNGYRTTTAICHSDCHIYSIKINNLEECIDKFPKVKQTMIRIAREKVKYYKILKDEIKHKYRRHVQQDKLIKDKRGDEWTSYMSQKRQMVKKKEKFERQIGMMKAFSHLSSNIAVSHQEQYDIDQKRAQTKSI